MRTIGRLVLITLPLYFLWEMAQAPAFIGMPDDGLAATGFCALAAMADVVIVLALFAIGACVFGGRRWFVPPRTRRYVAIIVMGVALQVLLERLAVDRLALWGYQPWHPRVPWTGTGVIVLLQPAILLPLVFGLLAKWERRVTETSV